MKVTVLARLDPPEVPGGSYNVNESWVLPAISKLNGRPEVAKDGQIARALGSKGLLKAFKS